MASSKGNDNQGRNNPASPYNESSVVGVHRKWGSLTFQQRKTAIVDWSREEQIALEEALAKYTYEPNVIRYAKIATQLKNKSVRDVAVRCRWMTKKDNSKRRNEDDINPRKTKDRKVHV